MNDWSPQPSVSLFPVSFRNFGHSFVMRYPIVAPKQTSIFLYLGKSTLLGLSFRTKNRDAISFGIGATQTGVWEVNSTDGIPTNSIKVGAACGVFSDRNNSLLWSLLFSKFYHENVRLNIYPGVLNIPSFYPGLFFTMGDGWSYTIGFTLKFSPIGFGMHTPY